MAERSGWRQLRDRRMAEPGADEAYAAARLAFELGKAVREMREQRGWTQARLADAAGLTQPAVARFEAGGTVPTIPVLERLACALEAELVVRLTPRTSAA
jgi:ribosome-binding protein aMBF1 (putative translation factor)